MSTGTSRLLDFQDTSSINTKINARHADSETVTFLRDKEADAYGARRRVFSSMGNINVIVYADKKELIVDATNELFKLLLAKPNAVLGFATGGTFEPVYDCVTANYANAGVSFGLATGFNLDEYVRLPEVDEQSYHYYMWHRLYSKIDMLKENIFIPNGNARNLDEEIRNYDKLIAACGWIDLQYLGIGVDGHIGFGEQGTPINSRTFVIDLAESTLKANSRYFVGRTMPTRAITMGIGTILEAKKILMLAMGPTKRPIIDKMKELANADESVEALTLKIPALALMRHKNATVMLDSDAGASFL